jgi:acetyltransferase
VGLASVDTGARLLAAFGVPTVEAATCASPEAAAAAATALGFPVVAKVVHPDLVHKSDVGAVRLGLSDPKTVHRAASELLSLVPGGEVLVQRQATGTEVVVGGIRDPQFGPAVMVGLGGTLVEVLGDVAFALPPLGAAEARRLLARLRGFPALAGARGRQPVDLDALAGIVTAVGDLLVAVPEVTEIDLNPVLATATGCVAVDWRILIAAEQPSRGDAGVEDWPGEGREPPPLSP